MLRFSGSESERKSEGEDFSAERVRGKQMNEREMDASLSGMYIYTVLVGWGRTRERGD